MKDKLCQGSVNQGIILDTSEYLHPRARESLATINDNFYQSPKHSQLPAHQLNQMRSTRFDSGVSDMDQVSSEGKSPVDLKGRPISTVKNYDYADYGHQYEELPHGTLKQTYVPEMDSHSENHSSGGTTVGTPSEAGDSAAIIRNSDQRKRYNPLYDAMINSSPNIYNKVKTNQEKEDVMRQTLRTMKVIIVMLLFVSCASLALSIFLFFSSRVADSKDIDDKLENLHVKYSSLQSKLLQVESLATENSSLDILSQIKEKVQSLQTRFDQEIPKLELDLSSTKDIARANQVEIVSYKDNVSTRINNTREEMLFLYTDLSAALQLWQINVSSELEIISKMEGPQGPQGIGNLSACYMAESGLYSAGSQTDTTWVPSIDTLQGHVVMFAFCRVSNRLRHHLKTKEVSLPDSNVRGWQYMCQCDELVENVSTGGCYVHIWLCPRHSFDGS